MRGKLCAGWWAFAQWLCNLQIPQGVDISLSSWNLILLTSILTVVTTQQGGSWRPWNAAGEPTMGRKVGGISKKQGHLLSFPQDQMLGNRGPPEPQHEFLAEVRRAQVETWSYWERWHFSCWITQLGRLFLHALGKNPSDYGHSLWVLSPQLLLTECNFREELLWLW